MKVLICGSRFYGEEPEDKRDVRRRERAQVESAHVRSVLSAFHSAQPIVRLIQGGAKGADRMAKLWAHEAGIPVSEFAVTPAEWHRFGKAAGPIRNKKMLREGQPDVVIAFPGGAGTAHMVKIAREAGVEVLIIKETSNV